MKRLKVCLKTIIMLLVGLLLLAQSSVAPGDEIEQIRAFTRMIEFDYVNWTLDALAVKEIQASVKAPQYMTIANQRKVVFEYLKLVDQEDRLNAQIEKIYANPSVKDPAQTAGPQNQQLRSVRGMEQSLKPIAESVLQYQVSTTIAALGLTLAGQPVPPVLYHVTPLPNALIISPRNVIRQDADISLEPGMTPEQMTQVESSVEKGSNVSALVVPIGGVGIYPTMVMSTTDLNWLLETVSHEWTHNFLTLRPLGLSYEASPQLRTINETTANLSGKEISRTVLERYYPDLVPPPSPEEATPAPNQPTPTPTPENPNIFNFNREMHKTRVQVDSLLAAGKTKEAEDYMEARRRFFWDHGYQIRRLNQAYFAFYGAYNDVPGGGAAGQDPVGPAVQELRKKSASLAQFLNRISWITSFAQLQQLVQQSGG